MEIKRVPLEFNWPLNVLWEGYVSPDLPSRECYTCMGSGNSEDMESLLFDELRYSEYGSPEQEAFLASITEDDLGAFDGQIMMDAEACERFLCGEIVEKHSNGNADVKLSGAVGLQGYLRWKATYLGGLSSLSCEIWQVFCHRLKKQGKSGPCLSCKGLGRIDESTPEQKVAAEAWVRKDPPEGPGWQMWEDVTSGSPVSPIFKTSAELVAWMLGKGHVRSKEAGEALIKAGWCPSAMGNSEVGLVAGADALLAFPPRG